MSVLIPIEIDANYGEDTKKLGKLNQHLDISYSEKSKKIYFSLDIAEDDHYITISVDVFQLLEAIGKAEQLVED